MSEELRVQQEFENVDISAGREDRFFEDCQEARRAAQEEIERLKEQRNKTRQDIGVSEEEMKQWIEEHQEMMIQDRNHSNRQDIGNPAEEQEP